MTYSATDRASNPSIAPKNAICPAMRVPRGRTYRVRTATGRARHDQMAPIAVERDNHPAIGAGATTAARRKTARRAIAARHQTMRKGAVDRLNLIARPTRHARNVHVRSRPTAPAHGRNRETVDVQTTINRLGATARAQLLPPTCGIETRNRPASATESGRPDRTAQRAGHLAPPHLPPYRLSQPGTVALSNGLGG